MQRVWMTAVLQVMVVSALMFGTCAAETLPKSAFPHLRHADVSAPPLDKLPDA